MDDAAMRQGAPEMARSSSSANARPKKVENGVEIHRQERF